MMYTLIHVGKFIVFCGILAISFFLLSFTRTFAYETTGQSAIPFGNGGALFMIEYEFGHKSQEIHMPILTKNSNERTDNILSYTIMDDDGNEVAGKSVGIVFSDAKIGDDGTYITPKNMAKKFVLVVVFTPDTVVTDLGYRLQVTQLPFSFNGTQQLQLNPSELKYYRTNSVVLK